MIDHDRPQRPMGLSAQRPTVGAILVPSRYMNVFFDKPESNLGPSPSAVHTAIIGREHCAFFRLRRMRHVRPHCQHGSDLAVAMIT
jgi:hypothetical protein